MKKSTGRLTLNIWGVGFLLASSNCFATPITIPPGGAQANFSGCVVVSSSGIQFSNTACTRANTFDAGAPNTGSYAGLTGGTVQNLSGAPVIGNLPTPIIDFVTFTAAGGPVHFDLTQVDAGVGTSAACSSNSVGSFCTPTGSPFTLQQVAVNKVSISLSLNGIAYLGSSTTGSSPTGILLTSQNLLPGTITGVLGLAFSPNGLQDSYSATVASAATSSVPEPGSLMMLCAGAGILGLGIIPIRRRR